jgi:hypothetical protein
MAQPDRWSFKKGVDKMNSGWRNRRSQPGGDREEHLRAVARMHRPKLVKREPPPTDVSLHIRRAELHAARLRESISHDLSEVFDQLEFQHSAEDNDEVILCRMLGGSVIGTPSGVPLISYNPKAAQTIREWPNCIALEPEGIHARRAYKKNLDTIRCMIDTTEIEADEVRFICPLFFVVRPRESDYLCYGQFRYHIDNTIVSYRDNRVSFADGFSIEVPQIGIFDFYLTAYYRTRYWLEHASA